MVPTRSPPVATRPCAHGFPYGGPYAAAGPALRKAICGDQSCTSWRGRLVSVNGVPVRLEWPDGTSETVSAVDVDVETGALVVGELDGAGPQRSVLVGEIRHLRLGGVV